MLDHNPLDLLEDARSLDSAFDPILMVAIGRFPSIAISNGGAGLSFVELGSTCFRSTWRGSLSRYLESLVRFRGGPEASVTRFSIHLFYDSRNPFVL